jgi:hypothetical protein
MLKSLVLLSLKLKVIKNHYLKELILESFTLILALDVAQTCNLDISMPGLQPLLFVIFANIAVEIR